MVIFGALKDSLMDLPELRSEYSLHVALFFSGVSNEDFYFYNYGSFTNIGDGLYLA